MGRWSTGAQTCESVLRIELKWLLTNKFIQKNAMVKGSLSWKSGATIGIESKFTEKEKYLRLIYTIKKNGKKTDYDYKIELTTIPSNLGKGEIPYFLCPQTGKRCRVLYSAYGYPIWKSRNSYSNRLYYESQVASKMYYANTRYWALERKLEKIYKEKYLHLTHKGQPTRKAKYIESLEEKREDWELERWMPYSLPSILRKEIYPNWNGEKDFLFDY